jgi:hypothetical protein
MKEDNHPKCFVIMPFSVRDHDLPKYQNDPNHWREVYVGLICPAIKKAGLSAERDDDDYVSRLIGEGIWSKIEKDDLVLCDLSSHNPNVHLELGWALRSNKRIVLIKDEVTIATFDLNQYFTLKYSSKLQPRTLRLAIRELSKVIKTTLNDKDKNYSMVSKLALQNQEIEAAPKGNLGVDLRSKTPGKIGSTKTQEIRTGEPFDWSSTRILKVLHPRELSQKLIGTTWRKQEGLEEIYFSSEKEFSYSSVGMQKWLTNKFSINSDTGTMFLFWLHDGYNSICQFSPSFNQFIENNGKRWYLIATEPYLHPSFKK